MSTEDLENYETKAELALYREYRDVVGLFSGPRALVAGFARTELSELRAISDELTRRHLTRSAPRRATLSEWSAGTMLGEDA